jgi:hypothetical protein
MVFLSPPRERIEVRRKGSFTLTHALSPQGRGNLNLTGTTRDV